MGDLDGQTFLITGANTGIGKETARALAARGGRVHIACRSQDAGRRAIEEISSHTGNRELSLLSLDLGDLESIVRPTVNEPYREQHVFQIGAVRFGPDAAWVAEQETFEAFTAPVLSQA